MSDCPRLLEIAFLKKWEKVVILGALTVSTLMIQNVLEFSRRFELDPDDFPDA